MGDTTFLASNFPILVDSAFNDGKLTESARDSFLARTLETHDDIDESYRELLEFLENHERYKLIARIEKADEVIEKEPDSEKKQMYVAARSRLIKRLEEIA